MNLHAIVSLAIGVVNPFETLTIAVSTGATINGDFTRTPTYSTVAIQGQVQAMAAGDLRLVEKLNIQGQMRKVYVNGQYNGVVREASKGGDLVTRADSTVWKIVQVLEYWPDWCTFAMTLQNGS